MADLIALTKLRTLDLGAASGPGRPAYLSAASGLVRLGSFLYVVADDELHLGVFGASGHDPGGLIRLFDGELPVSSGKRKKKKPDLEALALIPAHREHPHGALLALGSGSRPSRRTGALLGLNADGAVQGAPHILDLTPLLEPLEDEFEALNIEGALAVGDAFWLLQRGNKKQTRNAIITYSLAAVRGLLHATDKPIHPLDIVDVDLGEIDGIPLCFTDASALPNGDIVFTAGAEDTDNNYDDGRCAGSAVGVAGATGGLKSLLPLEHPYKVEGVDARVDGGDIHLLLVTDGDNADIPACLLSASIKW